MSVVLSTPLPDSAIVTGLLLALPVRVTAPVRAPPAVGVNFAVTVQDAPTASEEQLFVWLKSPLAVTPETVAAVVPVLVTVAVWVAEELPTTVVGNARLDGFVLRIGPGATPVPDSGTVSSMPDALIVRFPAREPAAVGVNATATVQDAPAAMPLPQVFVWLKSPLVAIDVTGAAPVPVLVIETVCDALDEPVATEPNERALGLMERADPLSGR
jgi:hypothetical protein